MISRVYVGRKPGFDNAAKGLAAQLNEELGIHLDDVKIYARYDLEGLTAAEVDRLTKEVLSEAPSDVVFADADAFKLQSDMDHGLVVEYQPGQYDQRQAGVLDTATAIFGHTHLEATCATVYDFIGDIDEADYAAIVKHLVNPVDQKIGNLFGVPTTIKKESEKNTDNAVIEGFISWNEEELKRRFDAMDLAMSFEDFTFIQDHFKDVGRDINETELAILDTYWSDHCRHTTFNTALEIEFDEGVDEKITAAYARYENAGRIKSQKACKPHGSRHLGGETPKGRRRKDQYGRVGRNQRLLHSRGRGGGRSSYGKRRDHSLPSHV